MKKFIIIVFAFAFLSASAQEKKFTAGFNFHKLGFGATYAGLENLKFGYNLHYYHQTGLIAGILRNANVTNPLVGPYYRFTGLDGMFHIFVEGQTLVWFQRNIVSGNTRDIVFAGYLGLNLELTESLSIEAAIGRSSFDWDQFLGINYQF